MCVTLCFYLIACNKQLLVVIYIFLYTYFGQHIIYRNNKFIIIYLIEYNIINNNRLLFYIRKS